MSLINKLLTSMVQGLQVVPMEMSLSLNIHAINESHFRIWQFSYLARRPVRQLEVDIVDEAAATNYR